MMNNHNRFIMLFFLIGLGFVLQQCTKEDRSGITQENKVLQAVEEIRIGQLEGESEYVFGAISYVAAGKNGEIFVADYQVPVVRMYDNEGTFVRNVGGRGRGPGEYTGISGMRSFPDGRLAIWNTGSKLISIYNQNGDFIESHVANTRLQSRDSFEAGVDGKFYVKTVLKNTPDMPNWKIGWLRYSPKGELIDTLRVPLDEERREMSFALFTASGRAHAFLVWPLNRLSAMGHLITGRNDEYAFQIIKPGSDPIRVERNYTPVQLKPEEKEQWKAWVNYYGVNNIIPDTKPPYKNILSDSQGRIWIQRYVEAIYTEKRIGPHFGPESRWWEPPTFDVFLPDGSFYATVSLPLNANFQDAKDDFVLALIKGEHDEEYVARFRLVEVTD